MHQHAQLADLVDVLAVDFDIVNGLSDARKRNCQDDRSGSPLTLGPSPPRGRGKKGQEPLTVG
jgi:hypothetical protein